MSEFSFPTDQMHDTGRQITSNVDDLVKEMTTHWTQIQDTHAKLPNAMQGTLTNFLTSWQQGLTDGLTTRQNIGKALTDTANLAEALEEALRKSFTM